MVRVMVRCPVSRRVRVPPIIIFLKSKFLTSRL